MHGLAVINGGRRGDEGENAATVGDGCEPQVIPIPVQESVS